jgi:hypothetical protein
MKKDKFPNNGRPHKIWDPLTNKVVDEEELFERATYIRGGAGEGSGMFRYHIVFVLAEKADPKHLAPVETIMRVISCVEFEHETELEKIAYHPDHIVCSVLISPEVPPLHFIELVISLAEESGILLRDEHYISAGTAPTEEEIRSFVKKVSQKKKYD